MVCIGALNASLRVFAVSIDLVNCDMRMKKEIQMSPDHILNCKCTDASGGWRRVNSKRNR